MGDRIDSKIEDHRHDPDPHPRWKKQIDAEFAAIEASIAAITPGGEVPAIPIPGNTLPTPIVPQSGDKGSSDEYARKDHKHPYDPATAGMATTDSLNAEIINRINADASLDAAKVNRLGDDAVSGTLSVGSSKPLDQAGTGERVVLAQADGRQRAEAKAVWQPGMEPMNVPTWGYEFNSSLSDLSGGNAFGLLSTVYDYWRGSTSNPLAWFQGGMSNDTSTVSVATTGTGDCTLCVGVFGDDALTHPGKYLDVDAGRFRVRLSLYQHLKLYDQSDTEIYSLALTGDHYAEVAFVVESGTLYAYVDGVLVYQGAEPTPTAITSCTILSTGDVYGTAGVCDLFCWDRALTADEVGRIRTERAYRPWSPGIRDVLILGPETDLRVMTQAGTGNRAVLAQADGTQKSEGRMTVLDPIAGVTPSLWLGAWDFEGGLTDDIVTAAIGGSMSQHLAGYGAYTPVTPSAGGAAGSGYGLLMPSSGSHGNTATFASTVTASLYTIAFFAKRTGGTAANTPLVELGANTSIGSDCDSLSYDRFRVGNGQIRLNGGSFASTSYVATTSWVHHAFVVNVAAHTVKHYVDGVLTETLTVVPGSGSNSTLGAVMSWNTDCGIDNLVLYDGELPAAVMVLLAAGTMPDAGGSFGGVSELEMDGLGLRLTDHAGTGQRMQTAMPDGTLEPVDAVTWDGVDVKVSGDPLMRRSRWPINVKDAPYNATGDGTTDDSVAIQAAIDAATATGRDVFVPSGVYRAMNVNLKSNVRVFGPSSAIIKLSDTATFYTGYHDCVFATYGTINRASLAGITLDGNKAIVGGDLNSGCVLLDLKYGSTVNDLLLDGITFQNNGYLGQMGMAYMSKYTAQNIRGIDTDAVLWFCGDCDGLRINGLTAEGGSSEAIMIGSHTGGLYASVPVFKNVAINNVIAKDKTSVVCLFGDIRGAVVTNCAGYRTDNGGTGYLLNTVLISSVVYSPTNISYENCVASNFGIGAKLTGIGVSWLGGAMAENGWFGMRITAAKNVTVSGLVVSGVGRLAVAATAGVGIKIDGTNWVDTGGVVDAQTYGPVESVVIGKCFVESASPKASECISVLSGVGGKCRYVDIKDNTVIGWINQGIALYDVEPSFVTNNRGYRGDTYSLIYNDSPSWCLKMDGNFGGPVTVGDAPNWDIGMYAYGGYVHLLHLETVQVTLGDATPYIRYIDSAALYLGRRIRMSLTVDILFKHLFSYGNIQCPGGVDLLGTAGSVFDLQYFWNGSALVWNLLPLSVPVVAKPSLSQFVGFPTAQQFPLHRINAATFSLGV